MKTSSDENDATRGWPTPAWPDGAFIVLTLAGLAALLAWGSTRHSPTFDEPVHLVAGMRHVQHGKFDVARGNPPLADAVGALPVAFMGARTDWSRVAEDSSFGVAQQFGALNGARVVRLIMAGRWACIPFSLIGGIVCYCWARDLYGRASGLFALALWCSCPWILGHGQLITADMAATSFGVLAFYAFWKWLRLPTTGRAVLAGLALGLAELSKFVWIILYALWPLLWIIWRSSAKTRVTKREILQALFIPCVSIVLLNLEYGFTGSFQPLGSGRLGQYLWGSHEAAADGEAPFLGPESRKWLGPVPVPLPSDYIDGILEIESHYTKLEKESYLRGEWRKGGWWYYYLYGLFIKTPLGMWLVLGLACASFFVGRTFAGDWRDEMVLLVPVAQILLFVTAVTTIQSHSRYVMPVVPFLCIFASKAVWGRTLAIAAVVGLAWSAGSSIAVYPHSLSYFNEFAGGASGGHHHLLDSNVAWGQDLLFLKRWLARNPQARPLYLVSFGLLDPATVGVDVPSPPNLRPGVPSEEPPEPGWYAVDVNFLHRPPFESFLGLRPVARIGYSIQIYHIEHSDKQGAAARVATRSVVRGSELEHAATHSNLVRALGARASAVRDRSRSGQLPRQRSEAGRRESGGE